MPSNVRMPSIKSMLCHADVAQLHKPLRHVLGASEIVCLFLTCPGHPAVERLVYLQVKLRSLEP